MTRRSESAASVIFGRGAVRARDRHHTLAEERGTRNEEPGTGRAEGKPAAEAANAGTVTRIIEPSGREEYGVGAGSRVIPDLLPRELWPAMGPRRSPDHQSAGAGLATSRAARVWRRRRRRGGRSAPGSRGRPP